VQSLIAAEPSILGLGELVLRDRERIQPKAGRLTLHKDDLTKHRALLKELFEAAYQSRSA
jgi:hypothetical protein